MYGVMTGAGPTKVVRSSATGLVQERFNSNRKTLNLWFDPFDECKNVPIGIYCA